MPILTTTNVNYTCFLCGSQAFYISVNSKQMRCVEKITQCPGHAKKAEATRQARMSKADRIKHMKTMSDRGNASLKELHTDANWRRQKGHNISKAKSTIPIEQRPLWEAYENIVDRITRDSWIYHNDKINPLGLPRGTEYELDHKYSKHQGFLNDVPPELIGHYSNLQMISRHSNRTKYNKCSIILEELLQLQQVEKLV
jgi:hypothetical protein